MRYFTHFLICLLAVIVASCDKNNLGTVDITNDVPVLSNWTITPSTQNVDNLTPTNGIYTVTTTVNVKSYARDNFSSQAITASIIRPTGTTIASGMQLRDDGVAPDARANDSVYSVQLQFTLNRGQTGRYRIQLSSKALSGNLSNLVDAALILTRRNSAPTLTNVSTPDSIQRPARDTIRVQFVASAADSDGLVDVREVYFKRVSPPDPTKFTMKDDGGLESPVNIGGILLRSGDDIAGDGKFSFLIPVLPTSTQRTNVFEFQCVDSFGDTSRSVQRSFTIR